MEEETEDQDEVGGLRMPDQGSNDADPVGGGEDDLGIDSEITYEQLTILASYDQIENRVYTSDEVLKLIDSFEGVHEPSKAEAIERKSVVDSAYVKSLKRRIAVLKKKSERLWDSDEEENHKKSEKIDEIVDSLEIKLDEFSEDLETQKEEAEDHKQYLRDLVYDLEEYYEELKKPTQKQVQVCINKLHSTNPGWDSDDKSHYQHVESFAECVKETFPELDKSSNRLAVPTNQQTHSSSPSTPIVINNPTSVSSTPQKALQQVVYTSKKSVSKDKVGLGCLLEAIGIFVFFITFFTIVGPLVGLALFACGYAIARQKRYVCRNCGNSLAPESKICPSCSAVYVTGILQILSKFLRVLLLIGLFFFVYALATGKWEGIQKSAEDWIEDKWGGDESTADPNVNNDGQSDVTNEPEGELPEIEPTDLIAERNWTDIQGRTLTASLIDALKRPDGSYYGKFRRPDGSEFEYDVLKLSKPDRARIKNALVEAGRIQE